MGISYNKLSLWKGCAIRQKFSYLFMFKKYKYIKGFIVRIFGIYVNVREDMALQKLIEINKKLRI